MMKRRWFVLGGIIGVGLLFYVGFYAYVLRGLPPISQVDAGLALPSTRIFDRNGRLLYEITPDGTGRNSVITLDQISPACVNALVATEDATYYQHAGVSFRGIIRAFWLNLRGQEVVAGGSTITQQVARNLLLDPHARAERTLRRKLREVVLALRLQRKYSKDDVLALWLNQTDFGNLAFGVDAAARAYYGQSAANLSLAECALLIGIPQSPPTYDPLTNFENATERQATVLRLMQEQDMITQEQADLAAEEPLQFASSPYPIAAPHAVMEVWRELEERYPTELYEQGLDVTTTIDLSLSNTAQEIVRNQLALLNDNVTGNQIPVEANNAAVVVMNPHTGEVLTMLGSPDYFDDAISGAMNLALVPRQPGSTLKPFTYALNMNPESASPWTASQMLIDVRTPFVTRRLESYVPANFDLQEHGPVTLREALGSSYNIPAVIALDEVGVSPFIQFMTDLGITELAENTNVDLSVTLGGGEVRLLNLTAAYGALANGGTRITPTLIREVKTADGEMLYQHATSQGERIIDPRVTYLITNILSDDGARRPAFGVNSVLNIGRPAAAKTGTTTDFRDNWVMGYTPDLVVGVWVGNADYTPMTLATGITGAGPIWHHVTRAALKTPRKPNLLSQTASPALKSAYHRECSPHQPAPTPATSGSSTAHSPPNTTRSTSPSQWIHAPGNSQTKPRHRNTKPTKRTWYSHQKPVIGDCVTESPPRQPITSSQPEPKTTASVPQTRTRSTRLAPSYPHPPSKFAYWPLSPTIPRRYAIASTGASSPP